MFCKHCGSEIDDKAVVCIHCGRAVTPEQEPTSLTGESKKGMGVLLSLVLGLIGLIIGLCLYKENTVERKTFINGWVIGLAISIILGVVVGIAYGSYIASLYAYL